MCILQCICCPEALFILTLLGKYLAQLDSMFTTLPPFPVSGIAALGCRLNRFCFIQQVKQKKTANQCWAPKRYLLDIIALWRLILRLDKPGSHGIMLCLWRIGHQHIKSLLKFCKKKVCLILPSQAFFQVISMKGVWKGFHQHLINHPASSGRDRSIPGDKLQELWN